MFDVLLGSCLWIKLDTKIPFIFKAVELLLRVSKILPNFIHFTPRNSCMQEAMAIIIGPHENSRTFLPRVCSSCHSIFTALPSQSINLRLALHHFSMPDILSGEEMLPSFPPDVDNFWPQPWEAPRNTMPDQSVQWMWE